jgi:peptidyl-tRNA hydrolase
MDIYQTEITKWIKENQTQKAVAHVQRALQLFRLHSKFLSNQTQLFCKSPASRGFYKKVSGGFVRNLL